MAKIYAAVLNETSDFLSAGGTAAATPGREGSLAASQGAVLLAVVLNLAVVLHEQQGIVLSAKGRKSSTAAGDT